MATVQKTADLEQRCKAQNAGSPYGDMAPALTSGRPASIHSQLPTNYRTVARWQHSIADEREFS